MRRWRWVFLAVLLLGLAGSGAGLSTAAPARAKAAGCGRSSVVNVVAHQDDDLVFMSPDLMHDVDARRCVRTVFLTAGDAGLGPRYWRGREDGAKAAYASMARAPDVWTDEDVVLGGHTMDRETLTSHPTVALIFLRLPDGFSGQGSPTYGRESLQKLWEGRIPVAHTVDGRSAYTRAGLVGTLRRLLQDVHPAVVRLLSYPLNNPPVGTRGVDHHDHVAAGYFGFEAQRGLRTPHRVLAYVGYPTRYLAANVRGVEAHRKRLAFYAYAAHDRLLPCKDDSSCTGHAYASWLSRQYSTQLTRTAWAATGRASPPVSAASTGE